MNQAKYPAAPLADMLAHPMIITASYTVTLDDWLEANRAHRIPASRRRRRPSALFLLFVLMPVFSFIVFILLNLASIDVPPRLLSAIMPYLFVGYLIGGIIILSGPVARGRGAWPGALLIVAGVALGVYLAVIDYRTSTPPPPQPARPFSGTDLLAMLPWLLMFLGTLLSVWRVLQVGPRREWESSSAKSNPTTANISEDGFTITQPDRVYQFKWAAFVKFRETKNLFVLYLSDNYMHLLPKRGFAPVDLAELSELLIQKVAPADPLSTGFSVVSTLPPPRPVHVQPLEPREFI